MTIDLRERFAQADQIGSPALWAEARRRATAPEAPPRGIEWPPGAARRAAVGALAFTVFAAAALFAWELAHPDAPPTPKPAVDLSAELPTGWSDLPAPPQVRTGAATAWTGSSLIVWGGYVYDGMGGETPASDGFVFDAASSTWNELPASPLAAREFPASVWTGKELLVWGGGGGEAGEFGDGAAYDPVTETWRMLPPAPIDGKAPLAVWTGQEMVVWGTEIRFPSVPMDGAAYDPLTDTWRRIADAPLHLTDATAVWTGEEMIVFGASLDGNNRPDTPTAVGAAYDPDTDTWRELPPSVLSPQANTAAWPASGELIAWDYDHATAAYDPTSDIWRELPRVPLEFAECAPESAAISGYVFGNYCGELAMYSVADDAWRDLTRGDLRGWVIEPIAAGDAFLVMAHSLELSEARNEEFQTKMFAYNPIPPKFVPPVTSAFGRTEMRVTFPDGASATVVYPQSLELAEMGLQPAAGYVDVDDPHTGYPVWFLYGRSAAIDAFVRGRHPVKTLQDGIQLWRPDAADASRPFLLRTRSASWTILISLRSASAARVVLRELEFDEVAGGFPVMRASGRLALADARKTEQTGSPVLWIGEEDAAAPTVPGRAIRLSTQGCGGVESDIRAKGTQGTSCLAGGSVFAFVIGDADFVARMHAGLTIDDFTQPLPAREPTPFMPATQIIDGVVRMPVAFPDGSRATLVFPRDLGLNELSMQPDVSYLWTDDPAPRYPIVFLHDPDASIDPYVDGAGPITLIDGHQIWAMSDDWEEQRAQLQGVWVLHRLDSWTVLVASPDMASAFGLPDFLHVRETDAGFPAIEAVGPVELAEGFGESEGATLTLGDAMPDPGVTSQLGGTIFLSPDGCRPGSEVGRTYGSACLADRHVFASIYGAAGSHFVRQVVEGLRIEDFRPA